MFSMQFDLYWNLVFITIVNPSTPRAIYIKFTTQRTILEYLDYTSIEYDMILTIIPL